MSIFAAKIHLYIVAKKSKHLNAICRWVVVFFEKGEIADTKSIKRTQIIIGASKREQ